MYTTALRTFYVQLNFYSGYKCSSALHTSHCVWSFIYNIMYLCTVYRNYCCQHCVLCRNICVLSMLTCGVLSSTAFGVLLGFFRPLKAVFRFMFLRASLFGNYSLNSTCICNLLPINSLAYVTLMANVSTVCTLSCVSVSRALFLVTWPGRVFLRTSQSFLFMYLSAILLSFHILRCNSCTPFLARSSNNEPKSKCRRKPIYEAFK